MKRVLLSVSVAAIEAFQQLAESLTSSVQDISINRDNVLADVIHLYSSDPMLPLKQVKVSFIGEKGDDFGGLTKELFTLIWSRLIEEYFEGESAVVPSLPLHRQIRQRGDYVAIGRILAHTTALLKMIPARLSQSTLLSLALGVEQVPDDILLQDFRFGFNLLCNSYMIFL